MSCAKIGRSAVADEKKVAKKSSSIVDRIIGERNTKRRPSRMAATDISFRACVDVRSVAGTLRISRSAATTNRKDTALKAYVQPRLAREMI